MFVCCRNKHRAERMWFFLRDVSDFSGGSKAGDVGNWGSVRVSEKIPWRRTWQPAPEFFPVESHGQRSLVGCSPWGRRESDTTESDLARTCRLSCFGSRPIRGGWVDSTLSPKGRGRREDPRQGERSLPPASFMTLLPSLFAGT